MKLVGWALLILGFAWLWPLVGPLLALLLGLAAGVLVLVVGAAIVGLAGVLALVLLVLGLFVAALKWALPLGILILGLWLLSVDRKTAGA